MATQEESTQDSAKVDMKWWALEQQGATTSKAFVKLTLINLSDFKFLFAFD